MKFIETMPHISVTRISCSWCPYTKHNKTSTLSEWSVLFLLNLIKKNCICLCGMTVRDRHAIFPRELDTSNNVSWIVISSFSSHKTSKKLTWSQKWIDVYLSPNIIDKWEHTPRREILYNKNISISKYTFHIGWHKTWDLRYNFRKSYKKILKQFSIQVNSWLVKRNWVFSLQPSSKSILQVQIFSYHDLLLLRLSHSTLEKQYLNSICVNCINMLLWMLQSW